MEDGHHQTLQGIADILGRAPQTCSWHVHCFVEDLTCFAPTANSAPRTKKLVAILEVVGNIGMEVQAEPSQFEFRNIASRTRISLELGNSSLVKDTKGLVTDQLLMSGKRNFTVRLTISPAVIRVSHHNNEEVLVEKTRVLLDDMDQ